MSHGVDPNPGASPGDMVPRNPAIALLSKALNGLNRVVLRLSMVALLLTSCVLTYSVVTRYFLKSSTDWQDEAAVFMLVGATFMCTAYVQSLRGHVGIEALSSMLPASINAARMIFVDVVSTLFCTFFTWKSWSLFYEAWSEGQTTSSSFAPPLWIPYSLMAVGMTLLTLQLFLQSATRLSGGEVRRSAT